MKKKKFYKVVYHSLLPYDNKKCGITESHSASSIFGIIKLLIKWLKVEKYYKIHITKAWLKPQIKKK